MSKISKAFNNFRYLGFKNSLGMLKEKLIIDRKRFNDEVKHDIPEFNNEYKKAQLTPTESSTPINILYLVHRFYPYKTGGTERFTYNLAKNELQRGNKVIVITLEPDVACEKGFEIYDNMLYKYYEYDGLIMIALKYQKPPLGIFYKSITTEDASMHSFARFIVEKHNIDLVHATYPQPFASFLAECKKLGLPYVVTCTDFSMMCHYASMVDSNGCFCAGTNEQTKCARVCPTYGCRDFKERFAAAKEVLQGAEIVTVPSEFVARVMAKEFPDVKYLTTSHGISNAFTHKVRTGKVKKFVYAGTLSPLKGIHTLINAFTHLEGDDLTLEIYGDGNSNYLKKLRNIADERVIFRGPRSRSEMPDIYSEADCVVIPSMWYETYNFVLREALMTGAIVVASDIGGMPEAVNNGKNGFLFQPTNAEDLERALRDALEFDFSNYEKSYFPSTEDEGEIYSSIYAIANKV